MHMHTWNILLISYFWVKIRIIFFICFFFPLLKENSRSYFTSLSTFSFPSHPQELWSSSTLKYFHYHFNLCILTLYSTFFDISYNLICSIIFVAVLFVIFTLDHRIQAVASYIYKYNLNLLSQDLKKNNGTCSTQATGEKIFKSTYLIICFFTLFIILRKKEIVLTVINVVIRDISSCKIT